MGKTPPKEEAAGSPRKKAARVEDAAPITASAPSPTRKTPPKGDEAEESPRKKAPRLSGVNLPGVSETNPTGKTPPKEKAGGSPPKTPRSPRQQGKLPAATGRQATVPESSEPIVQGVARASDKKRCNCNHVITDSAIDELRAIEEASPSLKPKGALTCVGCSDEDKEGIVKTRPEKSDLLICVTCKDHLCCGVGSIAYPHGHSRKHAHNQEHWFAVLYCDPQRGYCFKCNAEVQMAVKSGSKKLLAPSPSVGHPITALTPSPTGKTPLKGEAKGSLPKRSRSPRRQNKRPAAAVPLTTVPESSELIVKGVGRPSDEKWCHCNHVITDCSFLKSKDALTCFGCSDEDKEGIVKTRPEKSDLLICVTCSHYLCCGVGSIAYPHGHSRKHAHNEEHWLAVLYCDPQRGYCFKCDDEVSMQLVKFVSRKLLAPAPSVGQTEAAVNPEKAKMSGKVQAESHSSGCKSSDAQGYAIRGITNLGNTCYMSAVLQCLFVLGKLRERMLADRPKGDLPKVLKKLFVEASAAGDVLDPTQVLRGEVLEIIGFQVGSMQDSHEFLTLLRANWIKSDKRYDSQAPTVIDSFFMFDMLQEVSCKKCGVSLQPTDPRLDLQMNFPLKWHPTKSAASPQTSESPRSRNLEKMQTVSESGSSRVIGSEVIVEKTHKPLEVDSTQAQRISQGSISIKDFLSPVKGRCRKCAKDHEEPSASQSKNGEQIVGSANEDDVGDTVETLRFVTLPPVLILHLNRTSMVDNNDGMKINGPVGFEEYLDVKPFMDTRPADKSRILYRLVGVVEHIGEESLKSGHYIAYVRARKLGNQQEGSNCSSSWFCANDIDIRQVTLERVLNCEAYILFYEKMED